MQIAWPHLVLVIAFAGLVWVRPGLAQVRSEASEFNLPVVTACDDSNEWPPYAFFRRVDGQRSSELTGFTVELLRLIGSRRGFSVQVSMLPWRRCLESVRQGELLLLLSAIRTPEREAAYWLTNSIYETQLLYLWSKRQHPRGLGIRQQADLAKWRVGGLQGYSYSQMDKAETDRFIRAPNYRSLVQMLHLGRVEVALVNESVLQGHSALGLVELADEDDVQSGVFEDRAPSRFFMMTTRARPEGRALQQLLDLELARLERSGELAKLRNQFIKPVLAKSRPAP